MIRRDESGWRLEGPVNVDNAGGLLVAAEAIWQSGAKTIDLSEISEADSAVIALLLAWRRRASKMGRVVVFSCPPNSVCSLAKLYDVADLLFPHAQPDDGAVSTDQQDSCVGR